ncbi:hypothetical protein WAE56_20540 [Iodobacter sp. LRB]|uniref:hypothetical protein n=1 Tax=unclassified Iodobacter TaxID=235634 RepID=UPI000C10B228|nr:hypothetical protein [Iodobacter sp. BJB302]PHU99571.1 hypothetical protein CSQ88_21795 [Iodobacter sp. BJB302]
MFKFIPLVTLLFLSVSTAFAASPRMSSLKVSQPEAAVMRACTQDELCVEIMPGCEGEACASSEAGGKVLSLTGGQRNPLYSRYRLAELVSPNADASLQLWPKLIRFGDGILAGAETELRGMYSGGGASSTTLHLIAFLPDQAPFEVLQSASVLIRACFSEHNMKQRAGVCHDLYNFNASLALTGAYAAGLPVLRYRSKATSFPGPVSRSKDSLSGQPLRKRDIHTFTDPQCSYQRLYRFDPAARAYIANKPEPDCSDYTVP